MLKRLPHFLVAPKHPFLTFYCSCNAHPVSRTSIHTPQKASLCNALHLLAMIAVKSMQFLLFTFLLRYDDQIYRTFKRFFKDFKVNSMNCIHACLHSYVHIFVSGTSL